MYLNPEDIARLSLQERLRLIEQLWDSLADVDIPLTAAQQAELDRRLSTFAEDRARAASWDEFKAALGRGCP